MSHSSLKDFLSEVENFKAETKEQLEEFRLKFLSKKGIVAELFSQLKTIAAENRKEFGLEVNKLKKAAEEKFENFRYLYEKKTADVSGIDITLPGEPFLIGSHHPVSIVRKKIISIFSHIGFSLSEGPEIEDDWHNFSALNFPEDHPARDMQDTFFVKTENGTRPYALRTHTSSVQVRVMESTKPPIRTISPGRVYRNEAISARAHCFFHQVEGLYVDEGVSFADLKQTLLYFAREMFGADSQIRLRPSYFPFTEPSAEMDVSCFLCHGKGCNVCKYTGWVEILGCGMVHPAVLENCKIDSNRYTGYAFGMGIERITMLLYGIKDLRLFSQNDVRFLQQFAGL
ncbi:MAG: phenylalanine--tRNA ligase subunit alpha [Bacteroidia bacterium]|nr:phenylalanine--tRNA ligase subunit alpha [Bacteroidia bacterium]